MIIFLFKYWLVAVLFFWIGVVAGESEPNSTLTLISVFVTVVTIVILILLGLTVVAR